MLRSFQKTLSKQVTFKGIGLHSGKNSVMKVLPGKENLGIVFKRVDLESNNLIKQVLTTYAWLTLHNS